MSATAHRFHDTAKLATALQILLAITGAATLVTRAWAYSTLRTGTFVLHIPDAGAPGYQPSYWTGSWNSGSLSALQSLFSLLTWATIVVWLIWQHHATANLWARGYPDLHIRPGWAVGWWFIPFASLAMPLVAMLELDRRSTPDGVARRTSPLLGVWWAAWLANWVIPLLGIGGALIATLGDVFSKLDERSTSVDFTEAAHAIAPWLLVSGVLHAIAAGLAIAVVRRINAAQATLGGPVFAPAPIRPDLGR